MRRAFVKKEIIISLSKTFEESAYEQDDVDHFVDVNKMIK